MPLSRLSESFGLSLFVSAVILSGVIAGAVTIAREPKKLPLLFYGLGLLVFPAIMGLLLFMLEAHVSKEAAPAMHLYAELLRLISEIGVGLIAAGLCLPRSRDACVFTLKFENVDDKIPTEPLHLTGPLPSYHPGEKIVLFLPKEPVLDGRVVEVRHNVSFSEKEGVPNQVHTTVVYSQGSEPSAIEAQKR